MISATAKLLVLFTVTDRTCRGQTTGVRGFIQSPNWPGDYPANIECTWAISPQRGRRILFVVPEMHLVTRDRCRDSLVMRKNGKIFIFSLLLFFIIRPIGF